MARYKSIIQLRGRIGDLVYRRYGGINFVGEITGPTKEQILTAPEFANTRKNMAEFGACADFAEDIIKQIDKRNTQTSGKIWTGQRKILSQLMQLRKYDLIHPFGQRTINANSTLEETILEKKGNFNFDFIRIKSINLFYNSSEITGHVRFYGANILNNVPDQSKKWVIKLNTRLVLAPRQIFNTTANKYFPYRNNLTRIASGDTKHLNNILADNSVIQSKLAQPESPQPIIDTEDKFIILLQYSLEKLNQAETIRMTTENYITKIIYCNNLDL